MKEHLQDGSVDVVVTSPPYNIGIHYNSYRDKLPREQYLTWMEDIGQEVKRVLSNEGSFFLNVGSKPSDPWTPVDIAQRMRKHFVMQNVIHWVKSIAISKKDVGNYRNIVGDMAVGHYKPIGGKRFLHDCHEYIFHFTKTGKVALDRLGIGVPYQDKSNIGRWKSANQDKRCRGNTWFIPYETIWDRQSQRPHPSTFPIALPEMCIKVHGLSRTRLVLDPFMGIGSTAVACLRLGLQCVGFDIDQKYLDVASDRIRSCLEGAIQSESDLVRRDTHAQPIEKEESLVSLVRTYVKDGLKGIDLITKVLDVKPSAKATTIRAMEAKVRKGLL